MSKTSKKIIDSVSASELLKALSTLQNMSEPDNEESKVRSQFKAGNSKVMNYEQYMAKKVEGKQKNQNYQHQRKSISPLKQDGVNLTLKINSLKSRSHSPLVKKPQRTERSMLITQKKVTKPKDNKENKREDHNNKNQNLYRASFQSKKILDEKEKKGSIYVPIQFRTGQLIKEKQVKLAKLQKEKEISNILREKQCTFKPNIIKNYKKVTKPNGPKQQEKQLKKIQEESVRFDSCCQQNQFLCTPTQPIESSVHCDQNQYLTSNCTREVVGQNNETNKQGIKKYKNDKFNFLLDLIH